MIKKCLALLAILPTAIFAQSQAYTIKGQIISQHAPYKIYFANIGGNQMTPVDSAVIKNGLFQFSGQVSVPKRVALIADWNNIGFKKIIEHGSVDYCSIYLEKGTSTVTTPDSLFKASLGGSPINIDYQEYRSLYVPVIAEQNAIDIEYRSASEEKKHSKEFNDDLDKRFNALNDQLRSIQSNFIKSHVNSYISLDIVNSIITPTADLSFVEPLFNCLSAELRNSKTGKKLESTIQMFKQVAIGAVAPDFTQPDINGKPIKLSDFRGKYVLLDFWASWCKPCRQENPNVVKAYNQYKDKNFTILGVSLDNENSKAAWISAIKTDNLNWNHASDLKGFNNVAARLYYIESIPQNFLINPEGKIIAKGLRGEDLINTLNEILK